MQGFHIDDWINANRDASDTAEAVAESVGFCTGCFEVTIGDDDAAMVMSGVVMAQYKNPLTCITSGEAEIIAKALEIGYRIIKDQNLSQDDAILIQGLQARAQIAVERLK